MCRSSASFAEKPSKTKIYPATMVGKDMLTQPTSQVI